MTKVADIIAAARSGKTSIDTADVAVLVRHNLKRAFPGVTFRVRMERYSGGSSINVHYPADLPKEEASKVESLVRSFSGKGFDGMIDMAYYRSHWLLPDGSIAFAGTSGTANSGGSVEPSRVEAPNDAVEVRLGVSYVSAYREWQSAAA